MNRRFFFPVVFALIPFGEVETLLDARNPWRGADEHESIVLVSRAERVRGNSASGLCKSWLQALDGIPGNTEPYESSLKGWEPFEPDESKMIPECDEFPCAIKLAEGEVSQLASAPAKDKRKLFNALIAKRAEEYLKLGIRRPTESTPALQDPWKEFARRGFSSSVLRPSVPVLVLRRLEIAPREMKPVRQVLDRRSGVAAREGVVWIRDVYDNHHLDAWGEWTQVDCGPEGASEIQVIQGLLIESDQLKKTDILSRLARAKIRSAMKEQGARYLDRQFVRLSLLAKEKALEPAAAVTSTPGSKPKKRPRPSPKPKSPR